MVNSHSMRFTALPNGLDKRTQGVVPIVSVHCAFRLVPDQPSGVLADFPLAFNWPIQPLSFELAFRRGSQITTSPATTVSAPPELAAWSRIFPGDLAVRRFDPPPRKQRLIRTYRNGRLAQRWRDAYVQVAASIGPENDHLPVGTDPTTGLLAAFESAGFWDIDRKKVLDDDALTHQLEAIIEASGYVPHTPPPGMSPEQVARRDLLEFRRFLARALDPDPPDDGAEPGDRPHRVSWVTPPPLDFHEVTTACAAHAPLLRPLGLVFDLVPEVSWDDVQRLLGGPPDSVSITVGVKSETPFVTEPSPWTRCIDATDRFVIAPAPDSDLGESGFLRLGDPTRYRAEILDVEATTLKAIGVGATIQMRHRRRSRSTPQSETTPTMRASGIGITRIDRALRFHQLAFQRGDVLVQGMASDPASVVLAADDVLRGYRLDVLVEKATQWQSLVRRTGAVEVSDGGQSIDLGDSEGWVSDGPVSDDAGDLYLGEEQFRWDGWSPVAPKPGRLIDPEDGVGEQGADALPGVPVVARYRPTPGTLVPLRYGRRYQLRARVVDIAGNGPTVDATSKPDEITPPVLFGRLDAVGSPDVIMAAPRLPGEELHRVVLRTIRRELDADGVAGRHLLPPRTTIVEAERHGVLDGPGGRPDPVRYVDLVSRDGYSLHLDPRAELDPGDPNGTLPGGPDEATARFVPLDAGFSVDFLPDPLARWLQLRRTDGSSVLPAPFAESGLPLGGATWPTDARPVHVMVKETNSIDIAWYDENRLLVIGLPKAETLHLRLSSGFDGGDLRRFAFAEWVARGTLADAPDWPESIDKLLSTPLGRQIADGRNWAFTPWQPFTVLHAVKDPLKDPEFHGLPEFAIGRRPLAATRSSMSVNVRWHGISTGRLDLLASWTEGIDRGPGTAPPSEVQVHVVATELQKGDALPGDDGMVSTILRAVHDHGDTKHRRIRYQLEGSGAFLDNFLETREVVFPDGGNEVVINGLETTGIALGTVRLSGPSSGSIDARIVTFRREGDVSVADGEPAAYRLITAPGSDVARLTRLGDAIPLGVTLTLVFVTNPISHRSNIAPRNVFASARPAAPEIHSVIPTFAWDRTLSGGTATSRRKPAGVRIWLERPWWSSGLGEELAVLFQPGTAQPSDDTARFVTQWGRDPIHAVTNVRASLTSASFPLRSNDVVALRPPGGPVVQAVPHPVHFDADRDKWYCDIDLSLESYWPFVRLALARWQPNTISSFEPGTVGTTSLSLSPVVLADIVQVAPGRTASVTATSGAWGSTVRMTLQGRSSSGAQDTQVEAHVERQAVQIDSDLDWVSITQPAPMLPVPISGPQLEGERRWQGLAIVPRARMVVYRYRLVIEEYERYRTDGASEFAYIQTIGRRRIARPYPRDGRRLVHLDVIPLDGLI